MTSFLLFALLLLGQAPASNVPEPEEVGAVYLQDGTGSLLPLEQLKVRTVFFPRPRNGMQEQWLIKHAKSKVRVDSAEKTLFIVRLAAGTDPSSFSLLALEARGSSRWLKSTPHTRNTRLTLPFDVRKFGQSSYSLTPSMALAAGEYAFAQNKSNQVFCFGIGSSGKKKHAKNR